MSQAYIRDCATACHNTGYCQLANHLDILQTAQRLVNQGRDYEMSQALWCDEGEHAFSARDKGRREITITGYDEDGDETSERFLACSEHIPKRQALEIAPIDETPVEGS